MSDIFSRIYLTNGWGGNESWSGPGSGSAATERMAAEILRLVAELGVTSVLDVACGDGFWMPELPGYVGIDVAPEAIARARRHHPRRVFVVGDVRDEELAPADLVIVRDAIQHLPLVDGVATLEAARRAGTWLLASTFVGGQNVDIATGDAYSPDLTAAPFHLPQPDRLIFDGWGYTDGSLVRDPRKHLGLWRS